MAELLLEDLMFEILLRLPVKTLARCRRVCRGWRDIIDSRDFTKSHSSPPSLLMLHHLPDSKAYDVVDLSSVRNGVGGPYPLAFKQLPVAGEGEIQHYVGNCNGLVCIADDDTGVLVWNPATGKQFRFGLPTQEVRHWGFGYDKDSDDYKVVALESVETTETGRYLLWIYSLRSRSWNCIDDFPYRYVGSGSRGVFVSGALHYPVSHPETNADSIGALHLWNLECKVVPTPDYNPESIQRGLSNSYGALDGRLFVIYYSGSVHEDEFVLWTMKEYGVKESWTKLIRFNDHPLILLIPLTYLEDEEVLLFDAEKIGWEFENGSFVGGYEYNELVEYEFRTRSFGRAYEFKTGLSEKLKGGHWTFRSDVYVPSLVSP